MGSAETKVGTDRDNARRVDFPMGHVIMALDVIEINGLCDTRNLIQLLQGALEVRVVDDAPNVTFEVTVLHRIEPHEGAK